MRQRPVLVQAEELRRAAGLHLALAETPSLWAEGPATAARRTLPEEKMTLAARRWPDTALPAIRTVGYIADILPVYPQPIREHAASADKKDMLS